jgi:two-component system response regulator YesN
VPIWFEWKEADQLVAILYVHPDQSYSSVDAIAQAVKSWVSLNLQFTASIYVGTEANDAEEISHSYQDALRAGQFRTVHGYNNIYYARESQQHARGDLYRQLQFVKSLVKAVRAAEPGWRIILDDMFAEMKNDQFPREKVLDVIQYIFDELEKLKQDMPDRGEGNRSLQLSAEVMSALTHCDLIDEIQEGLITYLNELVASMQQWQHTQDYHRVISEIKSYLLEAYSNPDLSLHYLSEKFELPSRVLSKLFKAETGERFVDYLIHIRVEEAKRRLIHTADSVQSIAEHVGYLQVISFIRTFKKSEGVTPGEFRKLNQAH